MNLVLRVAEDRLGCVEMLDPINYRFVLTSTPRINIFATNHCDTKNLLTNRGIVSDTTMKVTQVRALGRGGAAKKLSNTIVLMPSAWNANVNLDVVECAGGVPHDGTNLRQGGASSRTGALRRSRPLD